MAHEDALTHTIDWDAKEDAFGANIDSLISITTDNKKIIPLPIAVVKGEQFLEVVTAITMQVDCDGCDAQCCRTNPDGSNISMARTDYRQLRKVFDQKELYDMGIRNRGDECLFPSPCPFLHGQRCSIYSMRPLICVMYPVSQPATDGSGNPMLAVESSCPEARRIAKKMYITMWLLRKLVKARGR